MLLRLPGVVLLFTLIVAPVLPDFGSVVATGMENPTFELVRPGTYRLYFQAPPEAGPVAVSASSKPDGIDSKQALFTIRKTPAEVPVPIFGQSPCRSFRQHSCSAIREPALFGGSNTVPAE
jgi:hypothetical protein